MKSLTIAGAAPLDDVESRAPAALQAQRFGVLTEIDIAATLRATLGSSVHG